MKYREKKDGEVEHSKEQNAASDIRFGMANYAGAVSADSSPPPCSILILQWLVHLAHRQLRQSDQPVR